MAAMAENSMIADQLAVADEAESGGLQPEIPA